MSQLIHMFMVIKSLTRFDLHSLNGVDYMDYTFALCLMKKLLDRRMVDFATSKRNKILTKSKAESLM